MKDVQARRSLNILNRTSIDIRHDCVMHQSPPAPAMATMCSCACDCVHQVSLYFILAVQTVLNVLFPSLVDLSRNWNCFVSATPVLYALHCIGFFILIFTRYFHRPRYSHYQWENSHYYSGENSLNPWYKFKVTFISPHVFLICWILERLFLVLGFRFCIWMKSSYIGKLK